MLIPVSIDAVMIDTVPDKSMIVLRPLQEAASDQRALPIYIGSHEARSINAALASKFRDRPQTHDLAMGIIDALGGRLAHILIDRVDGMTFYARIVLEQDGDIVELDARPSDAIALAVRAHVPLYVDSPVFVAASVPYDNGNDGFAEREFEAFHEYIENIDPEDFRR